MVEHSLAIHRFETHLALTGLAEDAPMLGQEMDRAVRDLLPEAAGRELEPVLGSREGVLRIDRIALKLRLGRGSMSALQLADLLARQIAWAVAERAEGSTAVPRLAPGISFWPDHASYAAAYVALRLGLAPAPRWAFADFQALEHLAAHEAALELLAARPAILAALARQLGAAQAAGLAARLPERAAGELIERLLHDAPAELPPDAASALVELLATVPAGSDDAPAHSTIAIAAARLASLATADAAAVRQVVLLARLAVALSAIRSAVLASWGRSPIASDLAPEALVHLPEPARLLAEAAIAPLGGSAAVQTLLGELLGREQWSARPAGQGDAEPTGTASRPRSIASRLAGIGLLMPAALAHDLPDSLSPAALHRTLVAAAGSDHEAAARLDPLLAALAPFDPRGPEATFPPVPDTLRAAVPEAHRDSEAAGEGAAGWAACLTHAFAARLTGFEPSSLGYLRRQFLARPGTLHIAERQLTLVLDPLPLGILLRLTGIHGWSGRLPLAADVALRIEIRED